ncbi:uncharacterized protein LOC114366606 [Ostrinia furnacalis]|uniref:uncharacterized protein LOC114366606 n=1 Tax=Ostrinia furnacalis TaxID=93504 RepID=UPI00104079E5|nr:uncharacterized protein LOC114366606 [Ostrinia furnacalis]
MNDAKYYSLTNRMREEAQLLAERKWIENALAKIRAQRNALQVERLQLESMQNEIVNKLPANQKAAKNAPKPTPLFTKGAATSEPLTTGKHPSQSVPSTPIRNFLETEASCNMEALDLGVTRALNRGRGKPFLMEEFEEDEEFDNEDLMLDMNLFMNCTQQQ